MSPRQGNDGQRAVDGFTCQGCEDEPRPGTIMSSFCGLDPGPRAGTANELAGLPNGIPSIDQVRPFLSKNSADRDAYREATKIRRRRRKQSGASCPGPVAGLGEVGWWP